MVFQLRALCSIFWRMASELLSMLKGWSGRGWVGPGWRLAGGGSVGAAFWAEGTGEGVFSNVTFSVPQAERTMLTVKNNGMSLLSI
jgi:hypothetical protein